MMGVGAAQGVAAAAPDAQVYAKKVYVSLYADGPTKVWTSLAFCSNYDSIMLRKLTSNLLCMALMWPSGAMLQRGYGQPVHGGDTALAA